MKIVFVTTRIPSPIYGEDKALLQLAKLMAKRHDVYLCILSRNLVLKFKDGKFYPCINKSFSDAQLVILHHDTSIVKYIITSKLSHRFNGSILSVVFFVDNYYPTTFIKNIIGWFLAQSFVYFVTFSRYVYRKLRSFGILRIKYLPLIKTYRLCKYNEVAKESRYRCNVVRMCYIGVVDNERVNVKDIARLVYRIHNALRRQIELVIIARTDQRIKEVNRWLCPWLKVVIVRKFLRNEEKRELLRKCHVAMFTAKRTRFVVPPLFVVEAHSCGCLIYAPYLANVFKEEELDRVYGSIDELIHALKEEI